MTLQETAKVLSEICALWPNFNAHRDPRITLQVWARLFAEDSYADVSGAVLRYAETEADGFGPSVGQLKSIMRDLRGGNHRGGEVEAWGLVSRALHNGLYGYREEYARLPEIVQQVIGDPKQLQEWAALDENEVQTVIASNFQRNYRAKVEAAASLPEAEQARLFAPPEKGTAPRLSGMQPVGAILPVAMAALPEWSGPSHEAVKDYAKERGYDLHRVDTVIRLIQDVRPDDWRAYMDTYMGGPKAKEQTAAEWIREHPEKVQEAREFLKSLGIVMPAHGETA